MTVIATYFHYNDLRLRWPQHFGNVHFVATHPDPVLRARLCDSGNGQETTPRTVVLCEIDPVMARNICADLSQVLSPDEFVLYPTIKRPEVLLAAPEGPVLFAPRVWGSMTPALRTHPSAFEVRYVFKRRDLEAIGTELGWVARP